MIVIVMFSTTLTCIDCWPRLPENLLGIRQVSGSFTGLIWWADGSTSGLLSFDSQTNFWSFQIRGKTPSKAGVVSLNKDLRSWYKNGIGCDVYHAFGRDAVETSTFLFALMSSQMGATSKCWLTNAHVLVGLEIRKQLFYPAALDRTEEPLFFNSASLPSVTAYPTDLH